MDTETKPTEQTGQESTEQTVEPTGQEMLADAFSSIKGADTNQKESATSKQESTPTEPAKEATQTKTEESGDEKSHPTLDSLKKDYESRIEAEKREKAGLYKDLQKKREQLREIKEDQKKQSTPVQTEAKAVEVTDYISQSASLLKSAGFTDAQLEELKEKAFDEPFEVISTISFAMARGMADKTVADYNKGFDTTKEKELVDYEQTVISDIKAGWVDSKKKVMEKHPDLFKENNGVMDVDTTSEKFKIYDEEANKIIQEHPELQYSKSLPEIVMSRMEMRLLQTTAFDDGRVAESERQQMVDGAFTAKTTVSPPLKSTISLNEDETRQAKKDVIRGLFSSVQEWGEYYKNSRNITVK